MLASALICWVTLVLVTGALAGQDFYKVLGGECCTPVIWIWAPRSGWLLADSCLEWLVALEAGGTRL